MKDKISLIQSGTLALRSPTGEFQEAIPLYKEVILNKVKYCDNLIVKQLSKKYAEEQLNKDGRKANE